MTEILKDFYRNLDEVCNKKLEKKIESAYVKLLRTIIKVSSKQQGQHLLGRKLGFKYQNHYISLVGEKIWIQSKQ